MLSPLLPILLLTAISTPAAVAAQTTWNVSPGQSLQSVIDRASPGDNVLIAAGSYFGFALDRGLTIRAQGSVTITENFGVPLRFEAAIPAGQTAYVEGLSFRGLTGVTTPGTVRVRSGIVHFSDCSMAGAAFRPGLAVADAAVTVTRCEVTGGSFGIAGGVSPVGPGLLAERATIAAVESVFVGAPNSGFAYGGDGIHLIDSDLHAERVEASGGSGGNLFTSSGRPAVGIFAAGRSRVWIRGGTLRGGRTFGVPAGVAIANLATSPAALRDVLLVPGEVGGPTHAGPVDQNAPLWSMRADSPWQRGATTTLTIEGEPMAATSLWFVAGAPVAVVPAEQPIWMGGNAIGVVGGTTDALGAFVHGIQVPLDPALENVQIAFQALGHSGAAVHATAPQVAAIL